MAKTPAQPELAAATLELQHASDRRFGLALLAALLVAYAVYGAGLLLLPSDAQDILPLHVLVCAGFALCIGGSWSHQRWLAECAALAAQSSPVLVPAAS